ncbi:hypothetical protein GGR52DRAFT_338628 [Hypoxylon sp. FL1284]|nr:hypothetical protein GGR52DRAFT_338628 [Hypoxylon sp. FL1284]
MDLAGGTGEYLCPCRRGDVLLAVTAFTLCMKLNRKGATHWGPVSGFADGLAKPGLAACRYLPRYVQRYPDVALLVPRGRRSCTYSRPRNLGAYMYVCRYICLLSEVHMPAVYMYVGTTYLYLYTHVCVNGVSKPIPYIPPTHTWGGHGAWEDLGPWPGWVVGGGLSMRSVCVCVPIYSTLHILLLFSSSSLPPGPWQSRLGFRPVRYLYCITDPVSGTY